MTPSPRQQSATVFSDSFPEWLRWCSVATLLGSIFLLWASLFAYRDHSIYAVSLVPSLVTALPFAIFLNIYSFWHLRREHREADQAFRDTDCEFSSIFHNVLDGVLIVDSDGNCIDANPAAFEILKCSHDGLVGQNLGRFLSDPTAGVDGWDSFLRNKRQRGRAYLVAGDGRPLIVDFTAAPNYLPGRHILILCDATERTAAATLLKKSEERFQHMANNIREIFWMVDAATQEVVYVNRAYTTITGYSVDSLRANPFLFSELIHPEDRVRVLSRLRETLLSGNFDEEFRFTRADGIVRWIWVKGSPVSSDPRTEWFVGTAQDITSRKQAEMEISRQLAAVEAARAESEALRKATLALSQNLAMDAVLDTLLDCISNLIPFDRATVLFVDGFELMVAREVPRIAPNRSGLTIRVSENAFLERVLFGKKAIHLLNVATESDWKDAAPLEHLESWLGIPLIAAGNVLGILSLGSSVPRAFTTEHLRLAKSLAVSAAVAIQNARIHESAEIYAAELELRLKDFDDGAVSP